jgi:hypothetical protein
MVSESWNFVLGFILWLVKYWCLSIINSPVLSSWLKGGKWDYKRLGNFLFRFYFNSRSFRYFIKFNKVKQRDHILWQPALYLIDKNFFSKVSDSINSFFPILQKKNSINNFSNYMLFISFKIAKIIVAM